MREKQVAGLNWNMSCLPGIFARCALADSLDFEFVVVERVGDDLRLRLRPPGRAYF